MGSCCFSRAFPAAFLWGQDRGANERVPPPLQVSLPRSLASAFPSLDSLKVSSQHKTVPSLLFDELDVEVPE